MKHAASLNILLLVLGFGSFAAVVLARAPTERTVAVPVSARATYVVDSTGQRLPVRRYTRIASSSLIGDRLLLDLVEPERVMSFSPFTQSDSPIFHRFGRKPQVDARGDVERLVAMRPDLLVINEIVDPSRIARLRRGGLVVADLGPMRGIRTLRKSITMLSTLVGERARGQAILAQFDRRVRLLASRVPAGRKLRGMYLGIHGNQIYGGASGTSFHDVIVTAGLDDAAARYREWPQFSSEQVLAIDPDVIVTQSGRTALICRHAGFEVLRACRERRIVELDEAIINDPGTPMIEAAEMLHDAVYGRR